MRWPVTFSLVLAAALVAGGCGEEDRPTARLADLPPALPAQDLRAVPIGRDARFKPTAAVRRGAPTAGLRCTGAADRFGVHLELFAAGRVVVVPAGIGVAPPARRDGAFVRGGRCRYQVSTSEPTGVVEVVHGTRATLGDLFALWGQPLGPGRIASFRGRVRAWVGGRRVTGDPRTIVLRHHAQVVLAIGPEVPVHAAFRFRAGL